jgi:flagellar motor switch protein FliM
MAETDQDALLAVLNVKPLDSEIALLIEMPLALRLVDRLLGGGGKPRDVIPDSLTDLEIVILKRAAQSIVEPLSATWLDLAEVHFEIDSMQTSPMTFQLVPPSEPVLMLHLEARLDGLVSPIVLCLPYRSVEPIVNKLEHRHYEGQTHDKRVAGRVKAAISGIDVELRVEAGAVEMKVGEVLGLKTGDVIRLKRSADKGVVVFAGDVPTYVASPGRNGNARAVQVKGAWERGR